MARATWNGEVLAEGDDVILVEGNCYFAPSEVRWDRLKPATGTTFCGWKGNASYYDVEAGGKINASAAWVYLDPSPQPKPSAVASPSGEESRLRGMKAHPGVPTRPAPEVTIQALPKGEWDSFLVFSKRMCLLPPRERMMASLPTPAGVTINEI